MALTKELIDQLNQMLPESWHTIRDVPGGSKYVFLKWQKIRERLTQVYPDWEAAYSDPVLIGGEICTVRCKLTIAAVTREAIGNANINVKGKRGNYVEVAIADAFKNAAEDFGLGAYLDNDETQAKLLTSPKLRAEYAARNR